MFERHRLSVNVYFYFPSILVWLTVIGLLLMYILFFLHIGVLDRHRFSVNVYFDFPSILVCLTDIGLLLMYILIFPPYWCV